MSESAAVVQLRQELDKLGGTATMSSLSVRVKWGQGAFVQLGSFRQFLSKYQDVFQLDQVTVTLCGVTPPKALPAPAIPAAAGGTVVPPPPPKPPSAEVPQKPPLSELGGGSDVTNGAAKPPAAKLRTAAARPIGGKRPDGVTAKSGGKLSVAPQAPVPPEANDSAPVPPVKSKAEAGATAEKEAAAAASADPPWQRRITRKSSNSAPTPAKEGQVTVPWTQQQTLAPAPKHGQAPSQYPWARDPLQESDLPAPPMAGPPKAPWEEDIILDDQLSIAISDHKTKGIEFEIEALAKRIAPSEAHKRASQRCVNLIRTAMQKFFSEQQRAKGAGAGQPPSIEIRGAAAQDTELDGSDIEVLLCLDAGLVPEDREKTVQAVRERLEKAPHSNVLSLTDGMHLYPHATVLFTAEMKSPPAPLNAIAHVLIGEQPANGKEKATSLDDVITQLLDTVECSRNLVRLVKLWASNHGLSNHLDGFMNGVAWTLLTVFFLQKRKLVPPFATIATGLSVNTHEKIPSLTSLIRGFFEFLAGRAAAENKWLSVTYGQELPATDFLSIVAPPIFLEDPAEFNASHQQKNLAETVGVQQWTQITDEARKAAERLNAKPQRWFHWAEIMDPRVIPANKIQRLKSLTETLVDLLGNGAPRSGEAFQSGAGKGTSKAAVEQSCKGGRDSKDNTDGAHARKDGLAYGSGQNSAVYGKAKDGATYDSGGDGTAYGGKYWKHVVATRAHVMGTPLVPTQRQFLAPMRPYHTR